MSTQSLPEPFLRLLEAVPPRHERPIEVTSIDYDHAGDPLQGILAEPHGGGEKAVLIFHAWMGPGPYVEARARMLAGMGYTAFCADVYGAGVRPSTLPEMKAEAERYYDDLSLMRARAKAGFDVLTARGFAAEDVVVIGYCFGGTVALEHARTGQHSAGVVSFHGRLISHDPPDVASIAAPLLILTGGSDEIVPDEDIVSFANELRTAPDIDWELSVYAGALHAFTSPGPMYQAAADRRSWRTFTAFLEEFAPIP